MYIPDYNYYKPKSLTEALKLLKKSNNGATLAGGTDLLVEIKKGLRYPADIISLSGVKGLSFVKKEGTNLCIGATTTHNEIIANPLVRKYYPALANALSQIGSEQVRNTATIGGNLCTGASCCDSAPILIALNAKVKIASAGKTKTVSLKDFFIFNKKTILKKGEVMTKIILPLPKPGLGAHFEKFGLRESGNISVASVAVMVIAKKNICVDACIVIGAVAPTPKISFKATEMLKGKTLSELSENSSSIKQAGVAAVEDSVPIGDIRGGANYRRTILSVLTSRAIAKAIASVKK
ncbi:MAG: xanthine dehydrogenase family protein subunit M [Bacteroidetes bacterium]|nr:xanthine dehydrogenase family protein subunit M [Bacteroidota bacterium]